MAGKWLVHMKTSVAIGVAFHRVHAVSKVLSSEMDLAKSGLIRKVLSKGRGVEIFRKIGHTPSSESPIKF
jgi:hypothetical protein